ncbi:hypothetical protein B0J14DRAFT_581266 [Halenospora varia]|nr:hypothetical protein B0J14DRAFT_581266 [Halenospora varia]
MAEQDPIIIIGAGVVGLVLAQALKKSNIPYLIFDRDEHIDARPHGWGITIHWALDALKSCLPESLFDKLVTIQVDPAVGRNDTGQFLFLNLATAEPVWQIPPSKRLRVHREKFRKLVLEGINVQWNKTVTEFTATEAGSIVKFQDGTEVKGKLVIGADGANSRIRKILCPETGELRQLPVRFLGATVNLPTSQIAPLRALDPLLFQGCHPDTGAYMWFAILASPEINGSLGKEDEYYTAQLNISWAYKSEANEVPTGNEEKLKRMKDLSEGFEERFRKVICGIPEETEIMEIKLADWPCLEWPNFDGKVTLVGDAAHAMVMYRGEAGNHGIMDAMHLHETLVSISKGDVAQKEALQKYEDEVRDRTSWAVNMSRNACLDAHDFKKLNKDSALLARRAMITRKV